MNKKEYQWVIQNRKVLLDFCSKIDEKDFNRRIDGFGFQSMKETLVHVADCYHAWIGSFILQKTTKPITPKEFVIHVSLNDIKLRFEQADEMLNEFFEAFHEQMDVPIQQSIPWRTTTEVISMTPRKLLTHTITHEYHHKGQIVSMARNMGYEPPNTDILGTDD